MTWLLYVVAGVYGLLAMGGTIGQPNPIIGAASWIALALCLVAVATGSWWFLVAAFVSDVAFRMIARRRE